MSKRNAYSHLLSEQWKNYKSSDSGWDTTNKKLTASFPILFNTSLVCHLATCWQNATFPSIVSATSQTIVIATYGINAAAQMVLGMYNFTIVVLGY